MKRFAVITFLLVFVLAVSAPFAMAEGEYYPTSIGNPDANSASGVADPPEEDLPPSQPTQQETGTTSEQLLKEASSGKYRSVSLDEATGIVNTIAVRIIEALNAIAMPGLIIMFIVGAMILGAGYLTGSRSTRSWGVGTICGSIFIFGLIRLAPIIMATVQGIMS